MKTKHLFIALLFSILLFGCEKEKCWECETYFIRIGEKEWTKETIPQLICDETQKTIKEDVECDTNNKRVNCYEVE